MLNSIVQTQFKKIKSGFARPVGYPKTQITKVGVVGAGLMGHGISLVSSLNGIEVVLLDKTEELATYGLLKINEILKNKIDRNEISPNEREQILRLIYATDNYSILKDCDLIIEAVFEDEKLKSDIYKKLKKNINDNVILSSNTSSIPISILAKYSLYPENFIGIHFFSPVHKMKLVEVIRTKETSLHTIAKVFDFITQIKKIPILVNDGPGFYTTRVFMRYVMEGMALLSEGCSPRSIESIGKKAGFPVGPLTVLDEIGLKVAYKIRSENQKSLNKRMMIFSDGAWDNILDKMINEFERFGRSNKKGFYNYPEHSKKQLWEGLDKYFITLKPLPPEQEIIDRLLFSQIIEALYCYEEGVLNSNSEANIGSIYGWGFPSPGIFEFINEYGIKNFVRRSQFLSTSYGKYFDLPPTLNNVSDIKQFLQND
ncbi:MAG: 3-hydroxyacyl-CoA dehydrogenase family protein [Flavobacteriaceae bacterium]